MKTTCLFWKVIMKSNEVTTYKPTKVMASVIFVVNKQQTLESHCCLPHQCIWKAMIIETTNINQLLDTNKKPRHWKKKDIDITIKILKMILLIVSVKQYLKHRSKQVAGSFSSKTIYSERKHIQYLTSCCLLAS